MLPNLDEVNSPAPNGGTAIAVCKRADAETTGTLTPSGREELRRLQNRHHTTERIEGHAAKRRALLLRDQYRFAANHGSPSINAYAQQLGFEQTAVSLVWQLTAQVLLGINLKKEPGPNREALQYEVSQLARALATLIASGNEHVGLSDDEFFHWYKQKHRISGLAKSYLEANRAAKGSADKATGKHADGEMATGGQASSEKADDVPSKTPEQRVAEIFDNPAAVEIEAVPGISSGQEGVLIYRHEGDRLRVIRLTVDNAAIIGLAGYAPCPLTAFPADLRFYRAMLQMGTAFVPDEMSNIPIEDVPEGDIANDSYDMLPASAMYLVERDRFSIAHARRDDGLILEIIPSIDLGYTMKGDCFIDNLTRRRLSAALVGEADAAQFGLNPVKGVAAQVTIVGQTKTVAFTRKADGKQVNLIIKPRHMGSVWTDRVSHAFAPSASAIMSSEAVAEFDGTFMKVLLRQQKDRPVTISAGAKGVSFANGKAHAATFPADTQGTSKVQVMLGDLRRAMVGLLALPMTGGLTWSLDPKGLLLVQTQMQDATVRVFIQTLEPNREQPIRSRALRERVESLPKIDLSAAEAA